jgi:hypothetical protein
MNTAGLGAVSRNVDALGNDVTLCCHSLARTWEGRQQHCSSHGTDSEARRWRSSRLVAMAVRLLDYMYYRACHLTDAPLSIGALSAACHRMSCTVQTTANLRPACQIACCILRRCMMGCHQASPRQQRCTEQAIASQPVASHVDERWKGPRSTRASPP